MMQSLLFVVLTALFLVPIAQGQEDSHEQEARQLFEAGRLAYDDGRFDEALAHWERAYQLSGRAPLLFNIGQAADRLGDEDRAIEAFEAYLATGANVPNRASVTSRIAILRAERAREHDSVSVQTPLPDEHTAEANDEPRQGGIETEWWFWTVIGVVVVGAAVGVTLGVTMYDPGTEAALEGNAGSVAALRF